ncbi:MAG TPA: hypothetical protein VMO47_08090 [Rhodothermales bacterium]|nr:hypothetical protein [Rhodothermales bacterium]
MRLAPVDRANGRQYSFLERDGQAVRQQRSPQSNSQARNEINSVVRVGSENDVGRLSFDHWCIDASELVTIRHLESLVIPQPDVVELVCNARGQGRDAMAGQERRHFVAIRGSGAATRSTANRFDSTQPNVRSDARTRIV